MNKVILVGRLTRDPELRQTPQGISVTQFSVAVQRRYQRDAEQQQADFIDCVAWRSTAEFICRYFHKGSGIQLCGRIQTRNWDGQDGQKHYKTEVLVDEVEFNGPSKNSQQSSGGSYEYRQTPPAQSSAPKQSNNNADFAGDLDVMGFDDLDGSEDDLPF